MEFFDEWLKRPYKHRPKVNSKILAQRLCKLIMHNMFLGFDDHHFLMKKR